MAVKVDVDLSGIDKKFSKENVDRASYTLMNQMLTDMTQFVPRDTGHLRDSGVIDESRKQLQWNTPYAKAQFYGVITSRSGSQHRIHNYTEPNTGRRWDLRAKAKFMPAWKRTVLKGLNANGSN